MKLSITFLILFLLVVSTGITSFFVYRQNLQASTEELRNHTLSQVNLDISRLQNILYNISSEKNIELARINISVTAMDPDIQVLALLDEYNVVLAANQYIWTDSDATEMFEYDKSRAKKVKSTNQSQIFYDAKNTNILKGYYPVVLKTDNLNGLPQKRVGILFTAVSIENKLRVTQNSAAKNSLSFGLLMLIASMLVAFSLYLLISRRLKILTEASDRISKGEFDTHVALKGNDEITLLGKSFNNMAEKIKIAFAQRDEAEKKLVKLNISLEEIIHERTQILNEAQKLARMGNWVWKIVEDELLWSDEIYRIFGFKIKEFKPSYSKYLENIHPDDVAKITSTIDKAFAEKRSFKVEHRVVLNDSEIRWIREEVIPEFDKDGARIKITGIVQDITEERAEAKYKSEIEKQLQQMQKMESLGQLTGGIAHDFNNMLASICGYTELSIMLAEENKDRKLLSYLEQVDKSSRRATELIKQMMTFSRFEADYGKKESISLNRFIKDISAMLMPLLSKNISLITQCADEEYFIEANEVMLSQIVMNICVNAKAAMLNEQGEINIYVDKVRLHDHKCSSCFNFVSGEYINLKIKDNGSGIESEIMTRIFEPFFTTKDIGKGTGMGLSMVHGIMHKHHGHIVVKSEPGKGTEFNLYFSEASNKGQDDFTESDTAENKIKDVGNILIVDDEIAVAGFLKDFLDSYGFNVMAMTSCQEALTYYSENYENIDLVITDYSMPEMTGIQLTREMLKYNANMPVILCSGFSGTFTNDKIQSENIKAYLAKPVKTSLLLHEVRKNIFK